MITKILLIFVYRPVILKLIWNTLLIILVYLVDLLQFCIYKITSSANTDFLLFFCSGFFSLIKWPGKLSLNNVKEKYLEQMYVSSSSFLVGSLQSSTIENVISCGFFINILIRLKECNFIPILVSVFYDKRMLIFFKYFLWIYWDHRMSFFCHWFHLVTYHVHWFSDVKFILHS